jgi:hypothetical protein
LAQDLELASEASERWLGLRWGQMSAASELAKDYLWDSLLGSP